MPSTDSIGGDSRMSGFRSSLMASRTPTMSFNILWAGELISMAGSLLSSFALGVWLFRDTRSVSGYSFLMVSSSVPGILLSPIAGALIARWRRRRTLIAAELLQAIVGSALLLLLASHALRPWHLYVSAAINSALLAVETIGLQSCTAILLPPSRLIRANALVQTGAATVTMAAPALAGVLTTWISPLGVLAIDLATYVFAIFMIAAIAIPEPDADSKLKERNVRDEISTAWGYLASHRGLLILLCTFAFTRWLAATANIILQPMVLTFGSASALGGVMSAGNAGMVISAFALTVWGGPRGRIAGVLGGMAVSGAAISIAGLYPSVLLVGCAAFMYFAANQFAAACSEAIWQGQVPVQMQPQVFGLRPLITAWSIPLAALTGGPLADRVFEPLLARGGPLRASVGSWIGTGRGRGMGLFMMCLGICYMVTTLVAAYSRQLRCVDRTLKYDAELQHPVAGVAGGNNG